MGPVSSSPVAAALHTCTRALRWSPSAGTKPPLFLITQLRPTRSPHVTRVAQLYFELHYVRCLPFRHPTPTAVPRLLPTPQPHELNPNSLQFFRLCLSRRLTLFYTAPRIYTRVQKRHRVEIGCYVLTATRSRTLTATLMENIGSCRGGRAAASNLYHAVSFVDPSVPKSIRSTII